MCSSVAPDRNVVFAWPERFSSVDVTECTEILNAIVRTSGTNGYSNELTAEEGRHLFEGLSFAIARGEAAQLLVRDEKDLNIIGMATLMRYKQPDRRHVMEISRVAIVPERRGEFLVPAWQEVLRQVEKRGGEIIAIDISEDGPVRLWEHLGFKTWGVLKDYARVDTRQLDGYYMAVYVRDAWVALAGKRAQTA